MLTTIYDTGSNLISSTIAGGRFHYTHREPLKAVSTYSYELSYGESFYSISAVAFGDDKYWWAIADMNEPRMNTLFQAKDTIQLPEVLVKEDRGLTKFF